VRKSSNQNRRTFIKSTLGAGLLAIVPGCSSSSEQNQLTGAQLDEAAAHPVLKKELFSGALVIESLELLRYKSNFILRARTKDGAEGFAVSNNAHMIYLYPLLLRKVIPYFINKDACDLDSLIEGVFVYKSNYKLQGLALWICVATVEFAILDLLGKIANKSIGDLIGNIEHRKIAVYRANNYRGLSAEESIEKIKKTAYESSAKAVKVKIGGRMSKNKDYPPGRTEKLIPLVRETFGDDMVIYADSNGSYTVDKAIEIGRLLEEYNYDFYEEPVPFDWLEETKMVADALSIPVAGGEQETSLHRFRWLIGKKALQIVQPDLFYFGGMIRCTKVARMARVAGMPCVPHISGSGLGYVYMLHFVSTLDNAGPFHEFKGANVKIPLECQTSSLRSENGEVTVPTGAGLGVEIDPDFLGKHVIVHI